MGIGVRQRLLWAAGSSSGGIVGGFVRGEQVWCLVQRHANRFSLARNRNRQFVPANCGSSIGLFPGSSGSGLVEGFVRLRMGRTIRIVRVEAIRPNSMGVMADIIRSNFTKRLFPGISCRWSKAVHVARVGSARSNSWRVRVSVTLSNLANCLLGHAIWFKFDWSNFSVGSASNFRSRSWMDLRSKSWRSLRSKFWMNFLSNCCRHSRSNCFWYCWYFRSNCRSNSW